MKDFIENMLDAAEKRFVEMTKDCPSGHFRCNCGRLEHFDNVQPASENPYSDPMCLICFEEMVRKLYGTELDY